MSVEPRSELNGAPSALAPDADIVALLERYLEQAKSGEINGIAIAASGPGGPLIRTSIPPAQFANVAMAITTLYFALGATIAGAHNWQNGKT